MIFLYVIHYGFVGMFLHTLVIVFTVLTCFLVLGILVLVVLDFRSFDDPYRSYYPQHMKFCSNCYADVTALGKNNKSFYCPKCGRQLVNI
jgi:hypothetical protein